MTNKMMRVASALLVAVLLSTCAISGTFAKYVTSGSATDTARVAKWGVTITATGETFADAYAAVGAGNTAVAYGSAGATVQAGTAGDDVVAPGTKGAMAAISLSGTPEVKVQVTYAAEVTLNDKWKDSTDALYFPLAITVNGTPVDLSTAATVADVEAAIEAAVAAYSKEYAPGTDLSTVGGDSLEIAWEWPFYVSDANDVKDTYLGNQAAGGNAATISIKVTTTVTQVD